MKNYLLSSRCARQLLKMSRKLVNREEEGKRIAQTSGAISISMNQIIHNALNTNNQATGQIVQITFIYYE
jgi:hypothetical protein